MIMLYSVGRHETFGRGIPVVAFALITSVVTGIVGGWFDTASQALWLLVLGFGPFFAGRGMRHRSDLQRTLRDRTEELEGDQERQAELAVLGERARIAEELQVVVANGVSAMVVQAEAVPRLVAAADTDRAERALTLIEETGRDAMGEMRRLLGVLRRDRRGSVAGAAADPRRGRAPRRDRARGRARRHGPGSGARRSASPRGRTSPPTASSRKRSIRPQPPGRPPPTSCSTSAATSSSSTVADEIATPPPSTRPAWSRCAERVGLYGGRVHAEVRNGRGLRLIARIPLAGSGVA